MSKSICPDCQNRNSCDAVKIIKSDITDCLNYLLELTPPAPAPEINSICDKCKDRFICAAPKFVKARIKDCSEFKELTPPVQDPAPAPVQAPVQAPEFDFYISEIFGENKTDKSVICFRAICRSGYLTFTNIKGTLRAGPCRSKASIIENYTPCERPADWPEDE